MGLLLVLLLSIVVARAQELSSRLDEVEKGQIRALSYSLASAPDRAQLVLAQIGFDGSSIPRFKRWPAVRKFETAYLAAVEYGGRSSGRDFLRHASRIIAAQVADSIRYEPALADYFSEPWYEEIVPTQSHVKFELKPKLVADWVDVKTRLAILALERYVERVPGGLASVLASCCGHSVADVYDILRQASSGSDALMIAVSSGKWPLSVDERIERIEMALRDNIDRVARDARKVRRYAFDVPEYRETAARRFEEERESFEPPTDTVARNVPALTSIERKVQRIVNALDPHLSQASVDAETLLVSCCGHSREQALGLLRLTRTRAEAIFEAVRWGNSPERIEDRVHLLVQFVGQDVPEVFTDPNVSRPLSELRQTKHVGPRSPNRPRSNHRTRHRTIRR